MLGLRSVQRAKASFVTLRIFGGRLPVTVLKSLNDRKESKDRRNTYNSNYEMSIMICTLYQLRSLKRFKTFIFRRVSLIFVWESMQYCSRSWHPHHDILTISCQAWPLLLAENSKCHKPRFRSEPNIRFASKQLLWIAWQFLIEIL